MHWMLDILNLKINTPLNLRQYLVIYNQCWEVTLETQ